MIETTQDNTLFHKLLEKDPTLWSDEKNVQNKILQRLGWLDADCFLKNTLEELHAFAHRIKKDAFTNYVWLGMGGSSLFAKMLCDVFDDSHFHIIDTTDSQSIKQCLEQFNNSKALFFVASKSGTTLETCSVFEYIKQRVSKQQFVAISDQNTALTHEFLQHDQAYYASFINPEDVGGRFSSLTYYGLIPLLLLSGEHFERNIQTFYKLYRSDLFKQSVLDITHHIIKAYQKQHSNKIILHLPNNLQYFTHWVEQLIAESTGKQSKGFIPLPSQNLVQDRHDFIHIVHSGAHTNIASRGSLINNPIDITADSLLLHSYLWMHVTALLGHFLKINPFDEPNVTQAKQLAKSNLSKPTLALHESSMTKTLSHLKSLDMNGSDFIAVLFYGNLCDRTLNKLNFLSEKIMQSFKIPCVIYPGPQYLHSVGQYFKGGQNDGHYLLLIEQHDNIQELEMIHLEKIKTAQALGDFQALTEQNRACFLHFPETLFDHFGIVNQ